MDWQPEEVKSAALELRKQSLQSLKTPELNEQGRSYFTKVHSKVLPIVLKLKSMLITSPSETLPPSDETFEIDC